MNDCPLGQRMVNVIAHSPTLARKGKRKKRHYSETIAQDNRRNNSSIVTPSCKDFTANIS